MLSKLGPATRMSLGIILNDQVDIGTEMNFTTKKEILLRCSFIVCWLCLVANLTIPGLVHAMLLKAVPARHRLSPAADILTPIVLLIQLLHWR